MRRISFILALFLPTVAYGQPNDYLRSNPTFLNAFREVVQPAARSTVRVTCNGKDTCLGVVVGADGWILTKAHDLTGNIQCKLSDGRLLEARLIGVHEPNDLAILRISTAQLTPIKFASSKNVKAGSWVASVGVGAEPAAVGIVSVATRKVNEAYLGIQVDDTSSGLLVIAIMKKSAALKAGLRPQDHLLYLNGQRIASGDHLMQILAERRPGDTITLTVRRGNDEHDIKLTLQSREETGDYRS
ncbi:MAG TPA: PDZ domain-containing protein, partial [Gemmataceae bacterium]|nr:PDZ domain-containing protein [Gemmataceae bacterium]